MSCPDKGETDVQDKLRILVVGAHPADIFDQSGGTMAHHAARGDWVGCVVLTHGVRIHDKVISNDMYDRQTIPEADELKNLMSERVDVKEQEVRSACDILGISDIIFFGDDDAVLLPNETSVRRLASIIRESKPDVVITHFPKEGGGVANPHAAAGEIVLLALELCKSVDPGDRNGPHRVAQVFFFGAGAASVRGGVWSSEGGYTNDVFIDISDVVHLKLASLDALKSQGYGGAYARKRIETDDGAFGVRAGVAYAEGFISLKSTTHRYLPVSEIDQHNARLPDHELMRQTSYRINVDEMPAVGSGS